MVNIPNNTDYSDPLYVYIGKLEATLTDQETRESWWDELRDEIKNHAKILCCTHIIGYAHVLVHIHV